MFNAITSLFKELLDGQDLGHQEDRPELAIACLLTEVSGADHQISQTEKDAKIHLLIRLCQLTQTEAENLLAQAEAQVRESASLYDFTSQLRALSQERRFELIRAMWGVAHADGYIDPFEDAVIRKTAELLYVDHSEFIRAKLIATDKL
ncbi:tellurite resistance TerB family protein [Vibrio mangrovi]|uniref:Tellurite resistance protein TerB n=1 Tax=Vibrio mangrovi TaxID=474394 RepID=A0A1Y6IN71_9VIBR|nr:TerB family tellurite resistance protein [Vibrio mangrovi]MDW6004083.1 TerB family tellurite resistance protein [Vibrio mangrovi]SMR99119.1 Tellurite resistance protein TerB [Vibrio mangrovi]